jgi:hypothetical protein
VFRRHLIGVRALATFAFASAFAAAGPVGFVLAQEAGGPGGPAVVGPLRYACVEVSLPEPPADADPVVQGARARWKEEALTAGLAEGSHLFLAAQRAAADPESGPLATHLCSIVGAEAPTGEMAVLEMPARSGTAGFCEHKDVERCLQEAAAAAGYSEDNPWPQLPIYSVWKSAPAPESPGEVVRYLAEHKEGLASLTAGAGDERSFEDEGLRPLAVCPPPPGYPVNACDDAPEPWIERALEGTGIAWFIPVADAVRSESAEPLPEGD